MTDYLTELPKRIARARELLGDRTVWMDIEANAKIATLTKRYIDAIEALFNITNAHSVEATLAACAGADETLREFVALEVLDE